MFVFTAGRKRLDVGRQVAAAHAEARAEKLVAEMGHAKAVRRIEEEYTAAIEVLDDAQIEEAAELRKDPRALARMLALVGSGTSG